MFKLSVEKLSAEAQRFVELCGVEGDENKISVAQTLQEHPELINALDEYIQYREKYNRAVERKSVTLAVQHSLAKRIKSRQ